MNRFTVAALILVLGATASAQIAPLSRPTTLDSKPQFPRELRIKPISPTSDLKEIFKSLEPKTPQREIFKPKIDGTLLGIKVIGNGGNGVLCSETNGSTTLEVLDIHELDSRTIERTDLSGNWKDQARALALRLKAVSPGRTERLIREIQAFESETQFTNNQELELIPDAYPTALKKGCRLVQIAVQVPVATNGARYFIDDVYWNKLDETQKAILVLHELIYREALTYFHPHSIYVRSLVGLIASGQIAQDFESFARQLVSLKFFRTDHRGRELSLAQPTYMTAADELGRVQTDSGIQNDFLRNSLPRHWRWTTDTQVRGSVIHYSPVRELDLASVEGSDDLEIRAERRQLESEVASARNESARLILERNLKSFEVYLRSPRLRDHMSRSNYNFGNGGDIILCQDANGKAVILTPLKSDEPQEFRQLALSKLEKASSLFSASRPYLKMILESYDSSHGVKFLSDMALQDYDAPMAKLPEQCRRHQVMTVSRSLESRQPGDILIDQDLWNILDEESKALLALESVFAIVIRERGVVAPSLAQNLALAVMSESITDASALAFESILQHLAKH